MREDDKRRNKDVQCRCRKYLVFILMSFVDYLFSYGVLCLGVVLFFIFVFIWLKESEHPQQKKIDECN